MLKDHRSDRKYTTRTFLDYIAVSTLWPASVPNFFQYLFQIATHIQVLAILLWAQFELVTNLNDVTFLKNIIDIIKLFAAQGLFPHEQEPGSANPFLIGAIAYFFLFFIALLILLSNFYMQTKQSRLEATYTTVFGQFHISIGFWIINTVLLDIFLANQPYFQEDSGSLAATLLSIFLIICNYLTGAFYAIFSYNPFVKPNDLSTHTPIFQVGNFLFKAIISITLALIDVPGEKGWGFVVLSFLILLFQYYELTSSFPYYEYLHMRVALVFSSLFLSISGMNLIVFAINSLSSQFIIYTEGFLIVLSIQLTKNHFNRIIKRCLIFDKDRLRSEKDVLKRVLVLRYLFKKAKVALCSSSAVTSNELDFWGIWSSFIRKGNDPLNLNSGNPDDTMVIENLRKYYNSSEENIVRAILKDATKNMKHTNKLKTMLCILSLEHSEQIVTSIYYLTSISKPEGLNRVVGLKLHEKVQQRVYSFFNGDLAFEKTLDLKSYIDLESVSVQFLEMIYLNAKKYMGFWERYKKAGTKIKELYKTHLAIEKRSDEIEDFWKRRVESNKVFASSLTTVYSIYLAIVRNSPALGRLTLRKYDLACANSMKGCNLEGPLSQDNISSPNNITFYASMAKDKLGRILYISPNVSELLGWMQEDLMRLNINVLVPGFMQQRHDVALLEHLEHVSNGIVSPRLYKNVMTFVADKAGFKVPCYVYLSLYPYIQGELIYTAIVRLRRSDDNIILVDKNGAIEGFTRDVAEKFKLDPNKQTKMKDVCENYKIIEKAMENISKLIIQQQNRPVHADKEVVQEFSGDFSQTVKVTLHASNERFMRGRNTFKTYCIHITPKRIWESHYFILKLEEYIPKESRRGSITPLGPKLHIPIVEEEPIQEVPDELVGNHVDSPLGSTQMVSGMMTPSNTKRKATLTPRLLVNQNTQSKRMSTVASKSSSQSDAVQTSALRELKKDEKSSRALDVTSKKYQQIPQTPQQHEQQQLLKIEKKVKEEKPGVLRAFDLDISSVSSPKSGKYSSKLETAVYMVPRHHGLDVVKFLTLLFITGTVGILIAFQVKNEKALALGKEDAFVIDKSLSLLKEICRINKAVRLMKMFTSETLLNTTRDDRSRYQPLGLDVSTIGVIEEMLRNDTEELGRLNNLIRTSTYQIDSEMQRELFENKIPIYEVGFEATRSANIFDLTTEMVVNAIKVYSASAQAVQAQSFILDNSFGDIITVGESISTKLNKHNEITLQSLTDFLILSIVLMGVFGVSLLCLNINFIRIFVNKQKQLVDILERLDSASIERHMGWVTKFANILEENNMDSKKVNIKLGKEDFTSQYAKMGHVKAIKKSLNTSGIGDNLIRFLVGKTLLSLLMFSAYLVVFIYMQKQTKTLEADMNLVMISASYFYKANLLSTLIYEYIDENGTSEVRNHPIKEEWGSLVDDISQSQSFLLTTFLDEQNDAEHLAVRLMFTGNLCEEIRIQDYKERELCNSIADGTLQKGLVGLNTYVLNVLNMVKATFDRGSMTDEDKADTLKMRSLVTLEAIMNMYGPMIYSELTGRIDDHTKDHYDETGKTMKSIIVVYITVFLIVGGLVLKLIERGLERELEGWRKLIRQIPFEIINNNKMLKNYIVRNSDGILTKAN